MPNLWIIDMYSLMMFLGVVCCFILFWFYGKKHNLKTDFTYNIYILACVSIVVGILFAIIFQWFFDFIKGEVRGSAMTFYGGLVGGVITFLLGFYLVIKKKSPEVSIIKDIFPIAPACITVAHGFGRVGCFFAGCCYGIETTSWLGVKFPNTLNTVYPTQLFEALFLFILTIILFYLAYKKRNIYNLSIYLSSYGIFRFLLEFLRGDNRGAYVLSLSPSQWFSIVAIISSIFLFIIVQKKKAN